MIRTTRARRQFKEMLGQANHFLVTILIGLNAVENGQAKPGASLSAAWNPRDVVASSRRSREFVLDMALVRAVDALDAYLSTAYRKPSLFDSPMLRSAMDNAGTKVSMKFAAVCQHGVGLESKLAALCRLAIEWRNRRVHSLAENELSADDEALLRASSMEIATEYRGLDVDLMLSNFYASKEPTLKEAAGIIKVMQNVVEKMDAKLIADVDVDRLVREAILMDMHVTVGSEDQWKRASGRCLTLWADEVRGRKVPRYLESLGFTKVGSGEPHHGKFESIANRSPIKMIEFLRRV